MPALPAEPLLMALRRPDRLEALTPEAWSLLLVQARRARLLGWIAVRAEGAALPEPVRDRLTDASRLADHHDRMVRWEVACLRGALGPDAPPVVLLKGAAYTMAGLPLARGRMPTDLDVLVPRAALERVEAAALAHGWQPVKTAPYDQRYYRDLMHELPPLRHGERGTVLDIHHTIAPPAGRLRIDPAPLWAAARPLGQPGLLVPAPTDLVLHAVIHLFHDGEIAGALRDLVDIHDLLVHFGGDAAFWPALTARATELSVERPLFYALRFARRLLDTPVPEMAVSALEAARPPAAALALMDALVPSALAPRPLYPSHGPADVARWLLLARAHWRRMTPGRLIAHLAHKAAGTAGPG